MHWAHSKPLESSYTMLISIGKSQVWVDDCEVLMEIANTWKGSRTLFLTHQTDELVLKPFHAQMKQCSQVGFGHTQKRRTFRRTSTLEKISHVAPEFLDSTMLRASRPGTCQMYRLKTFPVHNISNPQSRALRLSLHHLSATKAAADQSFLRRASHNTKQESGAPR